MQIRMNIHIIFHAAAITALTLLPALAFSDASRAEGSSGPRLRYRIAVDQFKWNEIRGEYYPLPRDLREGLQAQLIQKLHESGCFQVMEREATAREQAQDEDQTDEEKRINLPKESAAASQRPRQRRTAAQYIITPTVVGLQETGGGGGGVAIPGLGRIGGKKLQTTLSINIRISDAETSSLLDSATAEGKVESKVQDVAVNLGGIHIGDEKFKKTPLGRVVEAALDNAVKKVAERLSKEPWFALVAAQDKSTGRVIINAGADAGVAAGMEFDINKTGEAIRDPETGDVISRGDETLIGRIRIVRVERSAAYGEVLRGNGFAPRHIVRVAR